MIKAILSLGSSLVSSAKRFSFRANAHYRYWTGKCFGCNQPGDYAFAMQPQGDDDKPLGKPIPANFCEVCLEAMMGAASEIHVSADLPIDFTVHRS